MKPGALVMDIPDPRDDGRISAGLRFAPFLAALGAGLFITSFGHASFAERRTPIVIPEGSAGVVAYGSLMSLKSMEETLGHEYEGPVRRVHLIGYERAWTGLRPNTDSGAPANIVCSFLKNGERLPFVGTVSMNVHPRPEGHINAVLYVVSAEDLAKLDRRERGYRRSDVTDRLDEFDVAGGKVFAYEVLGTRVDGSPLDEGTYIIVREFYDLVTDACDSLGEEFRDEFDRTTRPCEYPIVPFKDIRWEMAE